jgi:hypothetical protein
VTAEQGQRQPWSQIQVASFMASLCEIAGDRIGANAWLGQLATLKAVPRAFLPEEEEL